MAREQDHQEPFIDWEAEARVEQVKAFTPMKDHGPHEVDALKEPHEAREYNGLEEALLADFLTAKRKREAFEKLEEDLRAKIVKAIGKDRGDILRGTHVVSAKEVKGRVSTDWEGFVTATIGDVKPEDLAPYRKEGKSSVRIEVRELR